MKRFLLFTVLLIFIHSALPVWAEKSSGAFFVGGKRLPEVLATVNGKKIFAYSLINEVKTWRYKTERRGNTYSLEEEKRFAQLELEKIIDHELLFQKSFELRIKIPPATIQKEIQNILKRFPSKKMFLSALAFQRLTIGRLAKQIEKRLAEEEFLRKELAPRVQVSDGMVEAYYEINKSGFRTSAKYLVSHIFVATVKSGERIPEDPLDREKARRMVRMINAKAKNKIEEIENRLKRGEDFVELCKALSEDDATKGKGGFMGEIMLDNTLPELATAIAGLKPKETSGIVKSPYGFHILKLDKIIPDKQISLKDARSDVLNVLLKKELEKKRLEYLLSLRNKANIKLFF